MTVFKSVPMRSLKERARDLAAQIEAWRHSNEIACVELICEAEDLLLELVRGNCGDFQCGTTESGIHLCARCGKRRREHAR